MNHTPTAAPRQQSLLGRVFSAFIPKSSTPVNAAKKGKRIFPETQVRKEYYIDIGLQEWVDAVQAAEMPINPNYHSYYNLVAEVLKRDLRLRGLLKQAINKVISERFVVIDKKDYQVNQELTRMLNARFFFEIMREFCNAEFYGYRIVELGPYVETPEGWAIGSTVIIPQENINPREGRIYLSPSDSTGVPFNEDPYNTYLIPAGRPGDLGILESCAYLSIMKRFNLLDWLRSGEKFADPVIFLQTEDEDEKSLRNKEGWLSNLGKHGWGMGGKDDRVTFLERKGQNAFNIFETFIKLVNEDLAIGVNGQTATSTTQAWAGSADVQERTMGDYTEARLRDLMFHINDTVFPKLISLEGGATIYKALDGHMFVPSCFLQEIRNGNDPELMNPAPKPGDPGGVDPNGPGTPPGNGGAKKKPGQPGARYNPITGQFSPS